MPEKTQTQTTKTPTKTQVGPNVQKAVTSDSQGVYYNGVVCFVL